MLGRVLKFLYFDIGFKFRYFFWKHILISSGGTIGKKVKIYEGVRIVCNHRGAINIGDNVRILRNVTIRTSDLGNISIGNNTHIGESTIIHSDQEITIKDNVATTVITEYVNVSKIICIYLSIDFNKISKFHFSFIFEDPLDQPFAEPGRLGLFYFIYHNLFPGWRW